MNGTNSFKGLEESLSDPLLQRISHGCSARYLKIRSTDGCEKESRVRIA